MACELEEPCDTYKAESDKHLDKSKGRKKATYVGSVDELIGKALGHRLDVAERGQTGTLGEEGDGLEWESAWCDNIADATNVVHTAQGRDIDRLAADGSGTTDAGRVLTGASVDDGVDEDLEGVLQTERETERVQGEQRYLAGEEVDDLEGVLDDANSQQLLAVVASAHHEGVDNTLDDGALGLAEAADGIATSGVGDVHSAGVLDGDVVLHGVGWGTEGRSKNRKSGVMVMTIEKEEQHTPGGSGHRR
jgi:hypothetical protein